MEIHSLKDDFAKNKCSERNRKAGNSNGHLLITAIKPAAKNENRANIFINDKYEFSLDLAQVVDFKLKVGQTLTQEKIDVYKKASEFGKLYQRTLEWVLARPHSIKETRDYLRRKRVKREAENRQALNNRERLKNETKEERAERKAREEKFHIRLKTKELPLFSDDDIEKIITLLIEKKYLNDYEFVRYYLENRNATKGASIKKLKQELIKKGIENSIIEEQLTADIRSDAEEIQKIIKKKRSKYTDEKLIAYLVRQGFDYQQSKDAVRGTDSQN